MAGSGSVSKQNYSGFATFSQQNMTGGNLSSSSVSECSVDRLNVPFQLIIVVTNILHGLILNRMKRVNRSPALHVILLMSVDDIAYSSLNILWSFCIRQWLSDNHACLNGVIGSVWLVTATTKYGILAIACYDRYVAICRPFQYSTNVLLKNTTVGVVIMFILLLMTLTPTYMFSPEARCAKLADDEPMIVDQIGYLRIGIQMAWTGLYMTMITVASFRVLHELYKMRRGGGRGPQAPDPSVLKVTHLILVTVAVFICCFIPPIISEVHFSKNEVADPKQRHRARMVFDSYAIINVLVYGVMNKQYQDEVKKLLVACCPCKSASVSTSAEITVIPARNLVASSTCAAVTEC